MNTKKIIKETKKQVKVLRFLTSTSYIGLFIMPIICYIGIIESNLIISAAATIIFTLGLITHEKMVIQINTLNNIIHFDEKIKPKIEAMKRERDIKLGKIKESPLTKDFAKDVIKKMEQTDEVHEVGGQKFILSKVKGRND